MKLDGKQIAQEVLHALKEEVASLSERPALAFILVGNHPESLTYVNIKKRTCEKIGIESIVCHMDEATSHNDLLAQIHHFNTDKHVDGILVQQPLPPQIEPQGILSAIHPEKDVDGFHPINMGKLLIGDPSGFVPCTPLGVIRLLEHANIDIAGKEAVVVGRSAIVGKPLAALLLQKDATVTMAHSHTADLASVTRRADIVCVAIGKPKAITADMVKEGAVVIDIGITHTQEALVGDVDYENVAPKCSHITPVPGGVGPMTIAMLLSNTLLAHKRR